MKYLIGVIFLWGAGIVSAQSIHREFSFSVGKKYQTLLEKIQKMPAQKKHYHLLYQGDTLHVEKKSSRRIEAWYHYLKGSYLISDDLDWYIADAFIVFEINPDGKSFSIQIHPQNIQNTRLFLQDLKGWIYSQHFQKNPPFSVPVKDFIRDLEKVSFQNHTDLKNSIHLQKILWTHRKLFRMVDSLQYFHPSVFISDEVIPLTINTEHFFVFIARIDITQETLNLDIFFQNTETHRLFSDLADWKIKYVSREIIEKVLKILR